MDIHKYLAEAEEDIDKIADRVKSKIAGNSTVKDPEELNRLRNEISGLKNALTEINEEKKEER